LGQSREVKNDLIMLKYGTLVDWINTWGCWWHPFFSKTSGQPKEVKNGAIMLKFGTILDWMNTWRC